MRKSAPHEAPPRPGQSSLAQRTVLACLGLASMACGGQAQRELEAPPPPAPTEAPLVAAQPGAWFDASGSLVVVGAGRRLRLVLSAPVSACPSALRAEAGAEPVAGRASLPFHVVAEACRDTHPSILLAEEGKTASPAELERTYHEVARCAADDLALNDGWPPNVVKQQDPCPLSLGLGWRLPTVQELSGLSLDDRKAIAGGLFDTESPGAFGSLLLYARVGEGGLALATLSPNASEQAPPLPARRLDQPLFGASLRCVRDAPGAGAAPVLPHAGECLRELRTARQARTASGVAIPLDLQRLKSWLDSAELQPNVLRNDKRLFELSQLLASPALVRLAQEARDEHALTERYAELAEAVDDPTVSAAERSRRREEFAHLRRRLGGQIVQTAEGATSGRTQLGAVLARLEVMVGAAAAIKDAKKGPKASYEPLLSRLRELSAKSTP